MLNEAQAIGSPSATGAAATDAPPSTADAGAGNLAMLDGLGMRLRAEFDKEERDRQEQEQKWLEDLRQFKGIYDPEMLANIGKNRCRLFVRLTRAKVKATDSKLGELLFPAGDKNWSIEPSKDPALSPEKHTLALARLFMEMAQNGIDPTLQPPSEEEVREYVKQEAIKACSSMAEVIDDQLEAASYHPECRKTLHSGHLYGTGVLKGPVTEIAELQQWQRTTLTDPTGMEIMGGGPFQLTLKEQKRPAMSNVPIWNLYPEGGVVEPRSCGYIWERHVYNGQELIAEAQNLGMDTTRVVEHMRTFPQGEQMALKRWEADLRNLDDGMTRQMPLQGRYELLERWGLLTGQDLANAGVEVSPDWYATPLECWIWMLGSKVMKAVMNPMIGHYRPYNFYYLDKDETSIWGEGVPRAFRDMQKGFNASIRMAYDNGAASAGPQIEVNRELLDEDEDVETFVPFRQWVRTGRGPEAQYPAIRVNQVTSNVRDHLELAKLAKDLGDEVSTTPSFAYGTPGSQAANTLGGLSMLLGQINLSLKDVALNFDQGITEPVIRAMYNWNMAYSEREDIKGDYEVNALAASSLIAKELRSHAIQGFLATTANPLDAPYTRRPYLLRELAKSMDLEADKAVMTDADVKKQEAMMAGVGMAAPGQPGQPGQPPQQPPPGGKDGIPDPGEQGPKPGGNPMQAANPAGNGQPAMSTPP